jgi:MFS transporter, SP family, arabinose:H+ symporter
MSDLPITILTTSTLPLAAGEESESFNRMLSTSIESLSGASANAHPGFGKRRTPYLMLSAIVAGLGGLLFGFDNIVISGAIEYLSRQFHLGAAAMGWAAGCALIGCIAGSAAAGTVADAFGLKKGLAACAFCFALSSGGMWFAGTLTQFTIWRILGGLGIGAASIIAPMYIAEIAPTKYRGRLVTLYQLGIVLGILTAVFSNMLIQRLGDDLWSLTIGWRLMFLVGLAPALVFAATILPALESPRWLMKVGRIREAERILSLLNGGEIAQQESASIRQSLRVEDGKFAELFTTFRRPLLLGIMLAGLQQISGITPLFSYLPEVFRSAGAATGSAFRQSVLVSLVNLCFTLFALWLVDRAGRKTLILAGTAVQAISFLLVGWFYHTHGNPFAVLFFVVTFVAGHAFGNGVAMWVIISEIYPTKVRGRAMSIATTMLWIVSYLANQMFPLMQLKLGNDGTFWCFSAGALVSVLLVAKLVPETKDRPLEEITLFWTLKKE